MKSSVVVSLFLLTLACSSETQDDGDTDSDGDGGATVGGAMSSGGSRTGGTGAGGTGTGGTDMVDDCTPDEQPTVRGSSESCYSPFYNEDSRDNPDVLGCDCGSCESVCDATTQYLCIGTWFHKEVGTCDGPNACVEVAGLTFTSIEPQECLSGSGTTPCTWEVTFSRFVEETKGLERRDGDYSCSGMSLSGTFGPTTVAGEFDTDTGVLTWDGVEYTSN